MPSRQDRLKKAGERRLLEAARAAGAQIPPIPDGDLDDEKPDFRLDTESGTLGIELSELSRPACANYGIPPIFEEEFQREVLERAREQCRRMGIDVHVIVYFAQHRGKKWKKRELIRALTDVVAKNHHKAAPSCNLVGPALHEAFGQIVIDCNPADWWSSQSGNISVSQISVAMAERIAAKNGLLPVYRKNLPQGADIWLLLYSLPSISRNVPMFPAVNEWQFAFQFERVFWFTCTGNQLVEIRRAHCDVQAIKNAEKWMRMEFVCECGTTCRIDVELIGGPFGTRGYQHCGMGAGRCVPGQIAGLWENGVASICS